jgi:hypothetical protein
MTLQGAMILSLHFNFKLLNSFLMNASIKRDAILYTVKYTVFSPPAILELCIAVS